MNNFNVIGLSEPIAKILNTGKVDDKQDIDVLLGGLSNSNKTKRVVLSVLYEASHLWAQNASKSNRALKSDFSAFLNKNMVEIAPYDLTRMLLASDVERIIGCPIGTLKEGVLRPLTPLLSGKNEKFIVDVWNAALQEARKKKASATYKHVKIWHVDNVMKSDEFKGVIKKRGRKPSKDKVAKGDVLLPIGNEKVTKIQARATKLYHAALMLNARQIKFLLKKAEKFAVEGSVG